MASLTLSLNGKVLRDVPLSKERLTIGRAPGNDVVLDNLGVSGEHAVIVTRDNDSFLEDLNSTNGTQVNGQPVRMHFLQDGDVIGIARYRIRYESHPLAGETSRAASVATITVIEGPGAGREVVLSKPMTTIGVPGTRAAAIVRKEDAYVLVHVAGDIPPHVNNQPIAATGHVLRHGDVIEVAGSYIRYSDSSS